MRHPIVLAKGSRITELIILRHHQSAAYSWPELTLRNARLQFWVTGGRRKIRNTLKLCGHNICKHPNPVGQSKQTANLPIPRITQGNFDALSHDLAGPFNVKVFEVCKHRKICKKCQKKIKERKLKYRAAKTHNPRNVIHKSYICVFACHSRSAIETLEPQLAIQTSLKMRHKR